MQRLLMDCKRLHHLALGLFFSTLFGCLPGYLRLDIVAPAGLNQGTPVHFVVREVEVNQYRTESYDSVAMLVPNRDASILRSKVLYAKDKGLTERMWIKSAGKKPIAVYFLFTQPKGPWKMLFEPPIPYSATVELDPSSIKPKAQGDLSGSERPF